MLLTYIHIQLSRIVYKPPTVDDRPRQPNTDRSRCSPGLDWYTSASLGQYPLIGLRMRLWRVIAGEYPSRKA